MDQFPRPRASSISRLARKSNPGGQSRFSMVKAGELCLKLRAIDRLLCSAPTTEHHMLDFDPILSSDFTTVTVAGNSELNDIYILVVNSPRPDMIPETFVDAYTTALSGRPYQNEYRCSDFTRGPDPTCSEVLKLLPHIDKVLETSISDYFNIVNNTVSPFPLLKLPAELRLQVYSHLLPRATHLSLFDQPTRAYKPPRLSLVNVLRANRQVHDEVTKFFYEGHALFMKVACPVQKLICQDQLERHFETLNVMGPRNRQFFRELEIQLDVESSRSPYRKRYYDVEYPEEPFIAMLKLLPNLESVLISFSPNVAGSRPGWGPLRLHVTDSVRWLVERIPQALNLHWDLRYWYEEHECPEVAEMLVSRGGFQHGKSAMTRAMPTALPSVIP